MAARILPFRSFASPVGKPVMLSPLSGPLCALYSQNSSSKVVTMSNHARYRQRYETVESSNSMFTRAEQELAEGYLEVEITGLSLRRLTVVYGVILRGAWLSMLGSVRSLLRPTAAL